MAETTTPNYRYVFQELHIGQEVFVIKGVAVVKARIERMTLEEWENTDGTRHQSMNIYLKQVNLECHWIFTPEELGEKMFLGEVNAREKVKFLKLFSI